MLLVLLSIGFVAGVVAQQRAFSPIDEYVYFDYVTKVPTQGIVRGGEEVGEEARNELSCRGVQLFGALGGVCDVGPHDRDALYPYGGGTGADIHSPAYFWVTWAAAQPLTWAGVELLDAARMTGALWMSATLLGIYASLRMFGTRRSMAFGLTAGTVALPVTLWSFAYISTDAGTLASGAALALATIGAWQGRWSPWWLVPISAVAAVLKAQNLIGVGAAALALLAALLVSRRPIRRSRSLLVAPFAIVATGVVAQGAWLLYRASVSTGGRAGLGDAAALTGIGEILGLAYLPLLNLGGVDVPESFVGATARFLLTGIGVAAIVAGLLTAGRSEPLRKGIAIGTLTAGTVMAPALAGVTLLLDGVYFPTPSRYFAVLIPFVLALSAWLLPGSRLAGRIAMVAGAGLALAGILAELT